MKLNICILRSSLDASFLKQDSGIIDNITLSKCIRWVEEVSIEDEIELVLIDFKCGSDQVDQIFDVITSSDPKCMMHVRI